MQTKLDTTNNRDKWNHLKTIHKIQEQHTAKARIQETAEHSHTGHYTHFGKYQCKSARRLSREIALHVP
jgi:hypothetical protein